MNNKRKNNNVNSSPELEPYPKRLKFNELTGTNVSFIPIINLNSNKRQKTEHFSENGNMEMPMEMEIEILDNEERINCYYLDFY